MQITNFDTNLADWRAHALKLESEVKKVIVGQNKAIHLMNIAIFARGHVLLEGGVGVGKTTLLQSIARCIGGDYERIEGTVDLMPNDLIYHTYLGEDGKPKIDEGPLLKAGENLSVFFFNEINRARPQVHALMLRVMAERHITAFKQEYRLPHMVVFADRNQVEKNETFEIPSAARDRFMMEIPINIPDDRELRKALMFDVKFQHAESLTKQVEPNVLQFDQLNAFSDVLQSHIKSSNVLEEYALDLWESTQNPDKFGIKLDSVDVNRLIHTGASPRGMGMLLKAARVNAWLMNRDSLYPEDIHAVFHELIAHRLVFNTMYENRRTVLARELTSQILATVAVPSQAKAA
ncbi:AAA family ATPase [Methylotenera mobilis]|uniref:ATPase associated with various cellular activities AAA_3 n=1 Tax=Methylotenera mobilis (strain JLW8 / ATCC BAA-1282 / DSM 17540) TaxID=583345 RepID=C6WVR6_METML|nr:MoxR family ATPase [Methylotenera mobilis]ACT48015.1 ATPase associated with various cellular activities AAA_3 [Methylotenera mobilis JLW8]